MKKGPKTNMHIYNQPIYNLHLLSLRPKLELYLSVSLNFDRILPPQQYWGRSGEVCMLPDFPEVCIISEWHGVSGRVTQSLASSRRNTFTNAKFCPKGEIGILTLSF